MLSDVVLKWGGIKVDPMEVYKDIFKLGEGYIQKENEPKGSFKANPIAYFKNADEKHGHFRIMFEDKFEKIYKEELMNADFCVMNGITYFGAKYTSDHASKMYAMIFDIDGVTDDGLHNFFYAAFNKEFDYYPLPNYVALSGHGIHLYYVFENPVPLFPNLKLQLKELKYSLTERMWNKNTSTDKKVQKQGINQPFRVLGSKCKSGAPLERVEVYRINPHPVNIAYLNRFVPTKIEIDEKKLFKESKLTLEQAKAKYPEWYENKILNGKRRYWTVKRDLYDWWINQIKKEENGASYGHRYFCIMALVIYGIKCGISKQEIETDAVGLIPFLNGLNDKEPFTEEDIRSALECYDERYNTFPLKDIEKLTNIRIQRNKRNGLKQKDHLEIARAIQEIKDRQQNKNWREGNGRKPKKEIVQEWRKNNPNGKKIECERETGLSRPTVLKWWDAQKEVRRSSSIPRGHFVPQNIVRSRSDSDAVSVTIQLPKSTIDEINRMSLKELQVFMEYQEDDNVLGYAYIRVRQLKKASENGDA